MGKQRNASRDPGFSSPGDKKKTQCHREIQNAAGSSTGHLSLASGPQLLCRGLSPNGTGMAGGWGTRLPGWERLAFLVEAGLGAPTAAERGRSSRKRQDTT